MDARPLVSVVLPTRDRLPVFRSCLESLLQQTHRPLEIIIVDDGSTDQTPAFLNGFISPDPLVCVRAFRHSNAMGANPSRNHGIRESSGVFVAFLDDDCIAEPTWIERLLKRFADERVGAVTGLVVDPPPCNLFDLAHKGTHRVYGKVQATRMVAGNMCVRREFLNRHMLDEDRAGVPKDVTVSGRGDEEGLYLAMRAAGHEIRVAHDAVVLHDHHYTANTYFRRALRGGVSTARLGYKYYLPPRVELVPLFLAWVTLPLVAWNVWLGLVPAAFATLSLAAILYNELFRKAKTVWETFITLPLVIAFFHARMIGYVGEHIRLRTRKHGLQRIRLPRANPPPSADRT